MRRETGWVIAGALVGFLALACDAGTGGGIPGPGSDAVVDLGNGDGAVGDVVVPADLSDTSGPDAASDSAAGADEADATEAPEPHPFFDFAGWVRIEQANSADGGFLSAAATAMFWSGPQTFYAGMVMMEEEGACQFWVQGLPPHCEPECEGGLEWCGQDNLCHPMPSRLSAGELSFDGLLQEISAVPDEGAWYAIEGLTNTAPIFEAGVPFIVLAAGDEVSGFEAEIAGVGPMVIPSPAYELVDGGDNVFPWEPQGDGATIEVAFLVGWHGAPPPVMIWCAAPEADGSLVIPKHMVEMFPSAGCMGLFPHASWIRRVHRAVVETDGGPVEITATARKTFSPKHGECY